MTLRYRSKTVIKVTVDTETKDKLTILTPHDKSIQDVIRALIDRYIEEEMK